MPRAVISAAVDLEVASKIAQEARERGTTLSSVVNKALEAYLQRHARTRHEPQPPSGRAATVTSADQLEQGA